VNGVRLSEPVTLDENAEIQIGASVFTLKFTGDEPAAAGEVPPVSLVSPTVVTRKLRLMDLLVMVDGEEPGKVFPLEGDTVGIGRDPRNQIVLNDVKLSGFHVRLQRGLDGGLLIEDRGSTNGTYVNGHLLEDAQRLIENDLIQVGGTTLQLKRVG
jgi:pSer/pThr/pTyr-binding forkhead associated (FHA) protein